MLILPKKIEKGLADFLRSHGKTAFAAKERQIATSAKFRKLESADEGNSEFPRKGAVLLDPEMLVFGGCQKESEPDEGIGRRAFAVIEFPFLAV